MKHGANCRFLFPHFMRSGSGAIYHSQFPTKKTKTPQQLIEKSNKKKKKTAKMERRKGGSIRDKRLIIQKLYKRDRPDELADT